MPNRAALRYSLILLALLIAVQIGVNGLWLTTNVVTVGMDRMFHQVTSLAYDHILRQGVSLHSLFTALTWSDYYPPLVHLTVAGFYQMFGVSMDVAAMANSLYLALLLLAVYGIGERLAGPSRPGGPGPWVGLLSAFIVSLLPMIFAMSRYLYLDFALTAMVAVNVCLLLRSDRFERRGYALLYGLSLGLGLLVKWTFVVFAGGPLLLVLLRRDTLVAAWQAARRALTLRGGGWKRLAYAALLGLIVTGLWFVPNVQTTAALTLGYGLVPLSWLMWTFTWLFILTPSSRGSNLLAALGLGACVASGWYLTKINFLPAFYANAYGKPSGRSWGFGQYFDLIVSEQVSPVLAVLVLAAVVWLVVRSLAPHPLLARRAQALAWTAGAHPVGCRLLRRHVVPGQHHPFPLRHAPPAAAGHRPGPRPEPHPRPLAAGRRRRRRRRLCPPPVRRSVVRLCGQPPVLPVLADGRRRDRPGTAGRILLCPRLLPPAAGQRPHRSRLLGRARHSAVCRRASRQRPRPARHPGQHPAGQPQALRLPGLLRLYPRPDPGSGSRRAVATTSMPNCSAPTICC